MGIFFIYFVLHSADSFSTCLYYHMDNFLCIFYVKVILFQYFASLQVFYYLFDYFFFCIFLFFLYKRWYQICHQFNFYSITFYTVVYLLRYFVYLNFIFKAFLPSYLMCFIFLDILSCLMSVIMSLIFEDVNYVTQSFHFFLLSVFLLYLSCSSLPFLCKSF